MGWRRRNDDEDEQPDRGREPRGGRRGGDDNADQDGSGPSWLRRGRGGGDNEADEKPARPTGRYGTGGSSSRRSSKSARGRGDDDDKGGGRRRFGFGRGGDDQDDDPPARSRPFVGGSTTGGRASGGRGSRGRDAAPGGRSPIGAGDSPRSSRRGSSGARNVGGTGIRDRDPARPGSKSRTSYGGAPRGTAPLSNRDAGQPGGSTRPPYGGTTSGSSYGDRGTGSRDPARPGSATNRPSYGGDTDRPGATNRPTYGGASDRDANRPGSATNRPTYGSPGGSYNSRTSGTGTRDRDTEQRSGTGDRPTYGGTGRTPSSRNRPGAAGGDMPPRSASQRRTYGAQQPGTRGAVGVGDKTEDKKDEKSGSKRRFSLGLRRGSKGKQDDKKPSSRASQRGGAGTGTGVRDRTSGTGGTTGFGRPGGPTTGRPGSNRPGTGVGSTTTGRPGISGTSTGQRGSNRPGAGTGGTTTGRPGIGGPSTGQRGSNRPGAGVGSSRTGVGGTTTGRPGAGTAPPGRTSRRSRSRDTTGGTTSPPGRGRSSRSRIGGAAPAAPSRSRGKAPSKSRGKSRGATSTRAAPRGQAKPLPSKKEKGFTVQQGLDFDRKIDIVGVVLVAFALVTFFAVIPSMSFGILPEPTSGVTYTLNEILSQLFGWGKLAIPVAAFWVGMWLIREIFEDRGIELDYFRIVGRLMLFAGALAWLHMIQLFDTVTPTVQEFQPYSRDLALVDGQGGGWVGHQIYFFLLSQLLDFGTISVLVAWMVMGLMLSFDVSVVEIMTFVGSMFAFVKFTRGDRAQKRAARKMLKAEEVSVERPGQAPAQLGMDDAEAKTTRRRRGRRGRGKDTSPENIPARPGQPGKAPAAPAAAKSDEPKTDKAAPAVAGAAAAAAAATPSRPRINRRGTNGDDSAAGTTTPPAAPRTTAAATTGSEPPARRPLPRMTPTADADAVDSKADDKAEAGQEKSGRRGLFGRRKSQSSQETDDKASATKAAESDTGTDSAEKSRGGLHFGRRSETTGSSDEKPAIPVPPRSTSTAEDADANDKSSADARDGSESRRQRYGRRSQPDAEISGEGTPSPSADSANTPAETDDKTETQGRRGGIFGALRRSRGAKKEDESDSSEDSKPDAEPQKLTKSDSASPGETAPDLPARRPPGSQPGQAADTPPAATDRASSAQPGTAPRRPATPDAAPRGAAPPERTPQTSAARPTPASRAQAAAERPAHTDHPERPRRPLADPLASPADDKGKSTENAPIGRDAAVDRKGPGAGDIVRAAGAAGAVGAAASLAARERRTPIEASENDAAANDAQADSATAAPQSASDRAANVSSRLDELRKMREQRRSETPSTPAQDTPDKESAPSASVPERKADTPAARATEDAPARPAVTTPSERPASTAPASAKTDDAPAKRTPDAETPAAQKATPGTAEPEAGSAPAEEAPAQPSRPAWLQRRQSERQAKEDARAQTDGAAKTESPPSDKPAETERPAQPAGITQRPAPAAQRPATPEPKPDPDATKRAPEQTPTQAAAPAKAPQERPSPPVHRRSIEGRGPSAAPAQPAAAVGRGANAPDTRAKPTAGQPQMYKLPDFRKLLRQGDEQRINDEILLDKARIIEDTLASFGAPGKVVEVNPGPVITQFGVEPDYVIGRGGKKTRVKVGQIARLDADLALALAAKTIRIEAPVPGKGFVGIEVPNDEVALVGLYDIMESPEFNRLDSNLKLALGLSVDGTPVAADLTAMPHLLIAGTTGSGKSVCVNSIITALLLNNTPDQLQFIMVDPKRVELTGYNGIPHLVAPVVVELERIVGVLQWVQREMEERYRKFAAIAARNIVDYNKRTLETGGERMPYYVVVVDELADLMMLAPDETERLLARLAQMARATGIHLIISTQRPSVDIITGLIKANFPARIAFAVASSVDSRVILDQPGAEKLLGRGDMLFQSPDAAAPLRMQGVFVSDDEIMAITRYWKGLLTEETATVPVEAGGPQSDIKFNRMPNPGDAAGRDPNAKHPSTPEEVRASRPAQRQLWDEATSMVDEDGDGRDDLYDEAVELVQRLNKASISLLQRRLRIGYTRAARLIDTMEAEGIVGPAQDGSKPREVLLPKIESGDD